MQEYLTRRYLEIPGHGSENKPTVAHSLHKFRLLHCAVTAFHAFSDWHPPSDDAENCCKHLSKQK